MFTGFIALGVKKLGLLAGARGGLVDVQHKIGAATGGHILELKVIVLKIADDVIRDYNWRFDAFIIALIVLPELHSIVFAEHCSATLRGRRERLFLFRRV